MTQTDIPPVVDSHGEHHDDPPVAGVKRWICATNHKDIGTLYLWFSFAMFILGGCMALVIRAELFQPGLQFVAPAFFNQMTTQHGLVMIFGAIMPAFVGIANWMIPLQIGARDMALPRMNNLSFWILPFAFALMISTLFMDGGGPNFGWTFYAPLSTAYAPPSVTYFLIAIYLISASSIIGAINIVATVLNMRAPGMTLMKMPLFVWTWLVTAYVLLCVMPVLAATVTMVLLDVHFSTGFFDATQGGDPVMFQHMFWFFGHPEVYILILPAFGIVSHIIPTFARKRLFGYVSMVYAVISIALVSFIGWAQHMFTTGMPLASQLFFMYTTMLVAVPISVLVFSWMATMWRGAMTFEAPMLFSMAFLVLFAIGGFSGLMLAVVPADFQYHDTYFVVAHFHYVLVPGSLFTIIAAVYFWLPRWCGHMYDETMAKMHFWMSFVGVNLTFFPQHFSGLAGMPRRIPDYALQFADFNMLSSVGAYVFGFSQLIFLYVIITTIRGGRPAIGRPGKRWN